MNLHDMNVAALKQECKDRGLTGYSKLKKDELIYVLAESQWDEVDKVTRPKGPAKRYVFKARDRFRAKGKHNRNQAKKKRKRQRRLRQRKAA